MKDLLEQWKKLNRLDKIVVVAASIAIFWVCAIAGMMAALSLVTTLTGN